MISAFFAGALLGAGLALIFAPVTGKEVRNTIVHQYEELKEKIKELEKKLHKSGGNVSIKTEEEE
jgi:gas vesicle protein